MTKQGELSQRIADVVDSVDYQVEDIVLTLTGEFLERMQQVGISRADLARKLDVKPPRVTRILQGYDNFTLHTIVQIADALGCRLVFTLAPCGAETHWKHYFPGGAVQVTKQRIASASKLSDYSPRPRTSDTTPVMLEAKVS